MELGFTFKNEIRLAVPKEIKNQVKHRKQLNINKKRLLEKKKLLAEKHFFWRRKLGTDKIRCEQCNCFIQRRIRAQHLRTVKHLSNNYIM